jgi:glycosyltransferase involved in cell wall biosynthesis
MGLRPTAVEDLVTRRDGLQPRRVTEEAAPTREDPLVTVLTPVYNTEAYLPECIESVLAQTYENWEYVIVDNRSTDRSRELAEEYARRDTRVRVRAHEDHLEMLPNWNRALAELSPASEYCKVVHADDWLYPECLARMVDVAERNPSVGVVGAYRLEENRVNLDGLPAWVEVAPGRKVGRYSLLGGRYLFGSPSALLIRSELIRARENFYNERNLHADTEICYDLLRETDFGFVHQVLTFTRRHNEAATTFANRVKTHVPGKLLVLLKYGTYYLDEDEFDRLLGKLARHYSRSLLKGLFQLRMVRDPDYRKYHRTIVRQISQEMEKQADGHSANFAAAKALFSGLARAV